MENTSTHLAWALDSIKEKIELTLANIMEVNPNFTKDQALNCIAPLVDELHNMIAQTNTDSLTKTLNRSGLDGHLQFTLGRMLDSGQGHLMVVNCDLDHFKAMNDTHGHAAGDTALKEFASRLQREFAMQELDVTMARPGGDEFVVIINGVYNGLGCEWDGHPPTQKLVHEMIHQALMYPTPIMAQNDDFVSVLGVSLGFATTSGEELKKNDAPVSEIARKLMCEADADMYLDKAWKDLRAKDPRARAEKVTGVKCAESAPSRDVA